MRALASGMRQLAGTKTRYRRAYATPLAGLISGRAEYISMIVEHDQFHKLASRGAGICGLQKSGELTLTVNSNLTIFREVLVLKRIGRESAGN